MAKNFSIISPLLFFSILPGYAQQINIRLKVAHTYVSQIGVRELTGHNDGKSVEMFLRYCGLSKGEPWCAAFVCWSLGQNRIPNPQSGYCPDLFTLKNIIWKRTQKNTIQPLPSDIFGLYFPEKGRIAHVGFIEKWASTTVTTVEGNTNQAGSREGDGVYRKIRLTRQIYAVTRFIK
ncbi:MAG: CHAP domain-containing protein [Mucilaginibacter sp.]